ncbi:ubiquinone biosynthesis accessory factor UbiJ [Pseudoalteromonas sp. T1lg65]|uniref:ubiquinone biosynthesis accessory factor UbiJ n=1 Tax=Pseudoalteromonas sp. T1lg65 TaxID=2077101 RepID=UPI003F78EFAE
MLITAVAALLEGTLRQALKLDPALHVSLEPVANKILCIEIRDLNTHMAFQYSAQRMHVLAPFDGLADCAISADLNTLTQLKDPSSLTTLIRSNKLDLEGDLHIAQHYSKAFANIDIDWAEHFAAYLGDGPAQALLDKLNRLTDRAKKDTAVLQETFSSLLQDELKTAPHPNEFINFKQDLRALNSDLNAISARIDTLTTQKGK